MNKVKDGITGNHVVKNSKRVGAIWNSKDQWFCRFYIEDKSLMFHSKENAETHAIKWINSLNKDQLNSIKLLTSESLIKKSDTPTMYSDEPN